MTIECSNCSKALAYIIVTVPDADILTKVVARCDHCGDKSFIEEIGGLFAVSPTDDSIVVDMEPSPEDGLVIINTQKRKG